jgi:hypothetical protein
MQPAVITPSPVVGFLLACSYMSRYTIASPETQIEEKKREEKLGERKKRNKRGWIPRKRKVVSECDCV